MGHFNRLVIVSSSIAVIACTQVACTADTRGDEPAGNASAIVGGTVSVAGTWPGAAAVYKSGSLACGGSLVAASWVITAAHCVTTSQVNGGFSQVILGRHKLSGSDGEVRTVDKAFRHPSYNAQRNDNDIALIHLTTPSTMPLAKIVRSGQVAGALQSGVLTTVVGWGTTSAGGNISDSLREVQVPVLTNAACKASSGYSSLADNSVCAAYPQGGKDSCQGDSGGPLFQNIDGEQLEVGLVSWGIGCADPGAPGVYTRVGNYLSWLKTSSNGAIDPDAVPVAGADGGAPADAGPHLE